MPTALIKTLAAASGNSISDVEDKWEQAKKIVKKEYDLDEKNSRFWALTTGITKKMLAIKENVSFKQYLETYYGVDRAQAVRDAGFEASVEHDDAEWTATGKLGTNTSTSKKVQVAEYMHKKDGVEHRIWMDIAGNVYEDS